MHLLQTGFEFSVNFVAPALVGHDRIEICIFAPRRMMA